MRISKYTLATLATVCILFAILYKTVGYIMYSKELAKISVALGATIDNVEQHSTYPFRKKLVHDDPDEASFVLTKIPIILEYRDKQHGFSLPPTIFLSVDFERGKATNIEVSPQLELLNLADVTQLAKDLANNFNQAGWHIESNPNFATPDKFAKIFTNRQESGNLVVYRWFLNDKVMILRIERNITKEEMLELNPYDQTAEDQFLLDLEIYFKTH